MPMVKTKYEICQKLGWAITDLFISNKPSLMNPKKIFVNQFDSNTFRRFSLLCFHYVYWRGNETMSSPSQADHRSSKVCPRAWKIQKTFRGDDCSIQPSTLYQLLLKFPLSEKFSTAYYLTLLPLSLSPNCVWNELRFRESLILAPFTFSNFAWITSSTCMTFSSKFFIFTNFRQEALNF